MDRTQRNRILRSYGVGVRTSPSENEALPHSRASRQATADVEATESIELDLPCEREQWATVHLLRWGIDEHGRARNKTCTCLTCPVGANARPWPTKLELQDAGAPRSVPREDEELAEHALRFHRDVFVRSQQDGSRQCAPTAVGPN